jgi:hypothetical protein
LYTDTVPVDCEMQMATASVAAEMPAAAPCRVPRPLARRGAAAGDGIRCDPAVRTLTAELDSEGDHGVAA